MLLFYLFPFALLENLQPAFLVSHSAIKVESNGILLKLALPAQGHRFVISTEFHPTFLIGTIKLNFIYFHITPSNFLQTFHISCSECFHISKLAEVQLNFKVIQEHGMKFLQNHLQRRNSIPR